jgi:hypothetical protein
MEKAILDIIKELEQNNNQQGVKAVYKTVIFFQEKLIGLKEEVALEAQETLSEDTSEVLPELPEIEGKKGLEVDEELEKLAEKIKSEDKKK